MKRFAVLPVIALILAGVHPTPAPAKGVDTTPFWNKKIDAAAFSKMQDDRMAKARTILDKMIAAKGPRTIENTLRPYDDALLELDAVSSQSSLIENVHPAAR